MKFKQPSEFLVSVNKSREIIKMDPVKYKIHEEVSRFHNKKRQWLSNKESIHLEIQNIAAKLRADNRVKCVAEAKAFITLQDKGTLI